MINPKPVQEKVVGCRRATLPGMLQELFLKWVTFELTRKEGTSYGPPDRTFVSDSENSK